MDEIKNIESTDNTPEQAVDKLADKLEEACRPDKRAAIKKRAARVLKEGVLFVIQVLILTFIVINFIGRVSIVQGSSMQPSLYTDNRVFVNLFSYRFSKPGRGDIIIFQCPIDSRRDYIKRVVALPGETIEIKKGTVYINENELKEPYLNFIDKMEDMDKMKIPDGKLFVMGDNRVNSEDSRYWGPLDDCLIKGKAEVIFWPPESFKVLR